MSYDEGVDGLKLEFDTEHKMSFRREIIDNEGDRNLVMNKMSKVYKNVFCGIGIEMEV